MNCSIIIRTYNEAEHLDHTLQKIFSQKTKKTFEVIIVDSESTDETLKIAKKYPVKIVNIKKKDFSFGGSLNTGIKKAKGELIINLSGHAPPQTNHWLEEITKHFADKKVAGVYGKQLPHKNCNPLDFRELNTFYGDKEKTHSKEVFFSNANAALRRELWKQIPFDETLIGSEDHLWAKQMIEKGYVIKYAPKAAVYHSHNENTRMNYIRAYREAKEVLKIKKVKYTFFTFITSLVGGVILDYGYSIAKLYKPKWFFVIPKHRFMRCLGKYDGYNAKKSRY